MKHIFSSNPKKHGIARIYKLRHAERDHNIHIFVQLEETQYCSDLPSKYAEHDYCSDFSYAERAHYKHIFEQPEETWNCSNLPSQVLQTWPQYPCLRVAREHMIVLGFTHSGSPKVNIIYIYLSRVSPGCLPKQSCRTCPEYNFGKPEEYMCIAGMIFKVLLPNVPIIHIVSSSRGKHGIARIINSGTLTMTLIYIFASSPRKHGIARIYPLWYAERDHNIHIFKQPEETWGCSDFTTQVLQTFP